MIILAVRSLVRPRRNTPQIRLVEYGHPVCLLGNTLPIWRMANARYEIYVPGHKENRSRIQARRTILSFHGFIAKLPQIIRRPSDSFHQRSSATRQLRGFCRYITGLPDRACRYRSRLVENESVLLRVAHTIQEIAILHQFLPSPCPRAKALHLPPVFHRF